MGNTGESQREGGRVTLKREVRLQKSNVHN